jgi:D-alanyl-D-alanine dipeptidase
VQFYNDPIALYEEVHRSIAVPTVAGHPTGGAIDISIIDTKSKQFLDFGTKQYDYKTKDFYVFSKNILKKAKEKRKLLRFVMIAVGFAPFDGEWWHFSYGDREWAFYYKKQNAIYEQQKSVSKEGL